MPGYNGGILCLAHLGWNYVWQRPQHVMSRLAQQYPVIYVDEPEIDPMCDGEPYVRMVASKRNLTAWEPVFPDQRRVLENWRSEYVRVVQDLLVQQEWARREHERLVPLRSIILWFYTPTPFYFLEAIPAQTVVYDAMDELANFKNATRDLPDRESYLMAHADLVLVGGRSLYEARRHRHANVHLYFSGVEPEHFGAVSSQLTETAPEVSSLTWPVLGYVGVIDERIDLSLLRQLGADHPDWTIVMVGPVCKILPTDLPRLPNLYYLGQQPYKRLPNLMKGFDVCLMPFALNDATQYISPTKTLEYMAAHKPIVSTPLPDVVANWAEIVSIADGPEAFGRAVEQALDESPQDRAMRKVREDDFVSKNTWDRIVSEMEQHLRDVLMRREVVGANQEALQLGRPR